MPTIQSLIDKRANVWSEYQQVLARADDNGFAAEDAATLDRIDADIRKLSEDIERMETAAALDAKFSTIDRSGVPGAAPEGNDSTDSEARYSEAFGAWVRSGQAGIDAELRAVLQSGFSINDEMRALGAATGAAGGFTVPQGFRAILTETMKYFGPMLAVANTFETDTGNDLPWPGNDDTGNEGAYLAENTAVTEQDVVFTTKTLKAHTINSKLVRVAIQLIQDSAFDIDTFLPRKLGERIGRRANRAFTTGTGTNEPEGVQTNAVIGKTGATGQTTSVTYDDLIDLEHSVDVAYRNERSRYMLHDLSLARVRKLKDSQGRPLWEPSLQVGAPSTLNGRGYIINNDMPQMAASAKSVLFGDFFAGYLIRQVRARQAMRLTERYAEFLQVGFLAFERHDGKPDDAGAIRAYANSAT